MAAISTRIVRFYDLWAACGVSRAWCSIFDEKNRNEKGRRQPADRRRHRSSLQGTSRHGDKSTGCRCCNFAGGGEASSGGGHTLRPHVLRRGGRIAICERRFRKSHGGRVICWLARFEWRNDGHGNRSNLVDFIGRRIDATDGKRQSLRRICETWFLADLNASELLVHRFDVEQRFHSFSIDCQWLQTICCVSILCKM